MKIAVTDTAFGLGYEVVETDAGYRCGYVAIPRGHALFGVSYSDSAPGKTWDALKEKPVGKRGIMDVITMNPENPPRLGDMFDVHGSLTFSGPRRSANDWWLGFDCAHSGDAKDESLMTETRLASHRKYGGNHPDDVVRTHEYVEAECRSLARQIVALFGGAQ